MGVSKHFERRGGGWCVCGGNGGGGALHRLWPQNRNPRAEDFSPLGFVLPRPAVHGIFPQQARSPSSFKPPQMCRTRNPFPSLTLLPSPVWKKRKVSNPGTWARWEWTLALRSGESCYHTHAHTKRQICFSRSWRMQRGEVLGQRRERCALPSGFSGKCRFANKCAGSLHPVLLADLWRGEKTGSTRLGSMPHWKCLPGPSGLGRSGAGWRSGNLQNMRKIRGAFPAVGFVKLNGCLGQGERG